LNNAENYISKLSKAFGKSGIMKSDSRSALYKNKQRKIRSLLDPLYECVGDTVYMSLKSESELTAMKDRTMLVMNKHNYMTPEDAATMRIYHGIKEKMMINGRLIER
jgi:hypothetical protein